MSTTQKETKKGAAAIYVVIFTATLLSIISLSFIRLMLSETSRTTNYSLSQSAYNSALAGIEDAKIVLMRYQTCLNNAKDNLVINNSSIDCKEYVKAFTTDVDSTAEDCDKVSELLGYNRDNHETIIQTQSDSGDIASSAQAFDQAYTCVKISQKNKNYLTTLTKNYPTKIIPLRTANEDETNKVNRLVISWFSRQNLEKTKNQAGSIDPSLWHRYTSVPTMSGKITNNNSFMKEDQPTTAKNDDDYKNTFTDKPTVPSVIQATLIQTAKNFKMSQFYSARDSRTNRGTVTFRPTTASLYNVTETNYSNHIGGARFSTSGGPFATSAMKSHNTPLDVRCFTANNIETSNGYACTADIYVPKPINYANNNKRNYTTFFLVLNLPYGDPETEVSVEMRSCDADSDTIYRDKAPGETSGCTTIDFANVQPIVDSTGRANDLFRRVQARIEMVDTYFPIANYALAVNDPENNDDKVQKDFYVTNNCYFEESRWDGTRVVTTPTAERNCPNSNNRSN